jgi:hypothetical protein
MHSLLHGRAGRFKEGHHAFAAHSTLESSRNETCIAREAFGKRLLVIVVRHLEITSNEILDLGTVFQFLDTLF